MSDGRRRCGLRGSESVPVAPKRRMDRAIPLGMLNGSSLPMQSAAQRARGTEPQRGQCRSKPPGTKAVSAVSTADTADTTEMHVRRWRAQPPAHRYRYRASVTSISELARNCWISSQATSNASCFG